MSEEPALYLRDGDAFVGTSSSTSGWSNTQQAGGPVLALLGHVLEDIPSVRPMSLSRLTADLVRPVPIGVPLHVRSEVLRDGAKVQLIDLTVAVGDVVHAWARVLRSRDEDVSAADGLPSTTTDENPADALGSPDDLAALPPEAMRSGFLHDGVEVRRSEKDGVGPHGLWLRLKASVIAGEPIRATSRMTMPMDMVNLMGVEVFDRDRVTAINPDVSATVFRPPVGEWIALTGNTWFAPEGGHGMSSAAMCDEHGVFGTATTSQLLQLLG